MELKKISILIILISFAKILTANNCDTILFKTIDKLEKINSISYELKLTDNRFNKLDTNTSFFEYKLLRDYDDTIVGYKIFCFQSDKYSNNIRYYNKNQFNKVNIYDSSLNPQDK
jgi:hypothetical protein